MGEQIDIDEIQSIKILSSDNPAYEEGEKEQVDTSMTLNNVSGVIDRFRIHLILYDYYFIIIHIYIG